jgi:hypothetical protein
MRSATASALGSPLPAGGEGALPATSRPVLRIGQALIVHWSAFGNELAFTSLERVGVSRRQKRADEAIELPEFVLERQRLP